MAIKVNPPLALRMPQKLLQDAELRNYFQDIQTILFQLATNAQQAVKYGTFFDTTTQTAAATNTAYAVTFNNTDLSAGISRGTPTSRIIVDTDGVYNFQFSMQLLNTAGGDHSIWIWFRINGVDIANSATKLKVKSNNTEDVAAWNFVTAMDANDYFEIMWAVSDTALQIYSMTSAAPVPAVPSVILTVDRIGSEV